MSSLDDHGHGRHDDHDELRRALREAERAEAAPWVDYPPTPGWYPAAVGLWAGGLTFALTALDGAPRAALVVVLLVAELALLRWYVAYRRGVLPAGRPPRELRRPLAAFVVGALAVAATAWAAYVFVAPGTAPGIVTMLTVPLVARYEQTYAQAARRTRARLA